MLNCAHFLDCTCTCSEFANCFLPHLKDQWSVHYDHEVYSTSNIVKLLEMIVMPLF